MPTIYISHIGDPGYVDMDYCDENGKCAKAKHSTNADREVFYWRSREGWVEVDFTNGSPFEGHLTHFESNPQKTDVPTSPQAKIRDDAPPGKYKYTIRLHKGEWVYPEDPQIIIDAGKRLGGPLTWLGIVGAALLALGVQQYLAAESERGTTYPNPR